MLYEANMICAPTARFPSCHAASIAIMPDDRLACAWFAGRKEGSPDSVNLVAFLEEDGSWSAAQVVAATEGHSHGNPVLMPLPDGRVILWYAVCCADPGTPLLDAWSLAQIHYRFSEDAGRSWGPPRTLSDELGYVVKNSGLILSNGDWLLPIYDNRPPPGAQASGANYGCVLVSSDRGEGWERHGRMTADVGCVQPSVVELEPGHLLAYLRTRNYWHGEDPAWARIYRCESRDFGRSWGPTTRTDLPNNNSGIQMIRTRAGQLVLVYNHQASRERSPLDLAVSTDGGESWPQRRSLEPPSPDGHEYSYPALCEAPDGTIHVTYTWRRTHIRHVHCDLEWIRERR